MSRERGGADRFSIRHCPAVVTLVPSFIFRGSGIEGIQLLAVASSKPGPVWLPAFLCGRSVLMPSWSIMF